MPQYMILDVETTGLFDFKKPADAEDQPRLCSVAAICVGEDIGEPLEQSFSTLIKPDGWTIAPEITAINGLTTDRCEAEGRPIRDVLEQYAALIESGHIAVAFNAQFDLKQMRGEMRRAGMDDLFERTPNICTMRACRPLGIEKAGAKKGGFPKLADAFRHFYGKEPPAQHDALADATTCLMIFRKLMASGACPEPAVHYAKEPPAHRLEETR